MTYKGRIVNQSQETCLFNWRCRGHIGTLGQRVLILVQTLLNIEINVSKWKLGFRVALFAKVVQFYTSSGITSEKLPFCLQVTLFHEVVTSHKAKSAILTYPWQCGNQPGKCRDKRKGELVIFCNRREFVVMTKTTFVINHFPWRKSLQNVKTSKHQNVQCYNSLKIVRFCLFLHIALAYIIKYSW